MVRPSDGVRGSVCGGTRMGGAGLSQESITLRGEGRSQARVGVSRESRLERLLLLLID